MNLASTLNNIPGLPSDFGQLLVVRAGETLISSPEDLVKDKLSGLGMLDGVLDSIPKAVLGASIVANDLEGSNQGRIKNFREARERLRTLNRIRDEYGQDQGILLDDAKAKVAVLEEQKRNMEKALRHHAFLTASKIDSLQKEIEKFPSDLPELQKSVEDLTELDEQIAKTTADKEFSEAKLEHETWLRKAIIEYQDLTSKRMDSGVVKSTKSKVILTLVGVLSFFGVGEALWDISPWVTGGVCLMAVIGALFYLWKMEGKSKALVLDPRVSDLENEYQQRFGEHLKSLATLQEKETQLAECRGALRTHVSALKEYQVSVSRLKGILEPRIADLFSELEKMDWKDTLFELAKTGAQLRRELDTLTGRLTAHGIAKEDYLEEDPGITWDRQANVLLANELDQEKRNLSIGEEEQSELKSKIGREIGMVSLNWEELIGGLERAIEEAMSSYKKVTAEIIGQICVAQAVRGQKKERDRHISKRLQDEDLVEELQRIGKGRFSGLGWQDGKLSVTDGENRFDAIEQLSTGAKEQVMIALRSLFSRIYLGEMPAFLLLDDAFQQSDYRRREDLVEHTLRLVSERGWQIFYFTMDNHLRDLFKERAENQLGGDFEYIELS